MKLIINDIQSIGEIQKEFSRQFPYLRLNLFRPLSNSIPRSALRIADDSTLLGDIREMHNNGNIEINENDITGDVEKRFKENFDLYAQIFRRSGTKWIITTTTDKFSLKRQNEIGEEMTIAVPVPEPEDIHEQS